MNKKIKDLSEKWTKDQVIIFLWDLLDSIDTTNDVVKDDDKSFREMANNFQSKRWDSGIYCDGNNLYLKGERLGL